MKRFWKAVAVVVEPGGHGIALDGSHPALLTA